MEIRFSQPYITGKESLYINDAIANGRLSGDGQYSHKCHLWLKNTLDAAHVLLTHSCTAALEMAAILLNIQEGDEVIMPSYTFVSTANAFVLRGGIPVFVDIEASTLNINPDLIEAAITEKTKAIVVVHYAGVACNMDKICQLTEKYDLFLIEDAAQAIMSKYKDQNLGSFGHLSAFSFHETKNIISGEGGALVINKKAEYLIDRAEIIREKGTNRKSFFRGAVDKYSWVDIGSSFLPNELTAAFLYAQLEQATVITNARLGIWNKYHLAFQAMKNDSIILPDIPSFCQHNGHIYFLIVETLEKRTWLLELLRERNINAVFHYVPLHQSVFGVSHCKVHGSMNNTNDLSERIVRLPIWNNLEKFQDYIIEITKECLDIINS